MSESEQLDFSKKDFEQMKSEALEKLNRLEKMIDKKIDTGVQNLLDRKVTIQDNPFFKKKQAYKGLHTFQETANAVHSGHQGTQQKRTDVASTIVTHEVGSLKTNR